jgi:BCCT family betaine/carnitine transporter
VVFGELVYGSLGCWVFFAIWGGYAINLQTSDALDVYTILKEWRSGMAGQCQVHGGHCGASS